MTAPILTPEQARILRAISEGRFFQNDACRYFIGGEPRPDRRERERLRKRGLYDGGYKLDPVTNRHIRMAWMLTDKGRAALEAYEASAERLPEEGSARG